MNIIAECRKFVKKLTNEWREFYNEIEFCQNRKDVLLMESGPSPRSKKCEDGENKKRRRGGL